MFSPGGGGSASAAASATAIAASTVDASAWVNGAGIMVAVPKTFVTSLSRLHRETKSTLKKIARIAFATAKRARMTVTVQ